LFIRWQFKTEGHDIKFGILATDSENIQTVIMPIKKVACHEFEEIGVIKCKHTGECNLFFYHLPNYIIILYWSKVIFAQIKYILQYNDIFSMQHD